MYFMTLNLLMLGLVFKAVGQWVPAPKGLPELDEGFHRLSNGILFVSPVPALAKLAAVCTGTDVIW